MTGDKFSQACGLKVIFHPNLLLIKYRRGVLVGKHATTTQKEEIILRRYKSSWMNDKCLN